MRCSASVAVLKSRPCAAMLALLFLCSALPAAFSVHAAANTPPVISGTPTGTLVVGTAFYFIPTARDADGDRLHFSISNRPSWAKFDARNGALQGTPTATGKWSNIVIYVSDRKSTVAAPAFSIDVIAAQSANRAPTIAGTPASSLNANGAYSFRPVAADADGDALTFSITNQPTWASFNTATGQLAGTPDAADVGSYSDIVIRVSDGKASAALAAFVITVNQISLGSATLMWEPPIQNTDGSALMDLAGYRICYGTSAAALTQTLQVGNASVSTYVVENLAPATYYFAVKAYTTTGLESANSNLVSKVVQ